MMVGAVVAKLARSVRKMAQPSVLVRKFLCGFQCGAESRAFRRQMTLQKMP